MIKPSRRCDNAKPSYIREILRAANDQDMISLAGGLPATTLLPVAALQTAVRQVAREVEVFQYGLTEGEAPLRSWVCSHQNLTGEQDVLITTGSQQALDLIARTYLNPGDTVLLEAPCYLGALQVFQLVGAQVVTVEQHDDGPDVEQVAAAIRRHRPKLFYAVPDFHNPTGVCWSEEKRQRMAALLNASDTALIEDAPYRDLRYQGYELPYCTQFLQDNWFRLGSFSKVISPGLRVGFVCSDRSAIRPLAIAKQASDLHSTRITQRVVSHFLQDGALQGHVEKLIREYRHRRDTLQDALTRYLCHQVQYKTPAGGMFLWLRLPGIDTDALADIALEMKVAVVPASVFYPNSEMMSDALRLNFTHGRRSDLFEAVRRLSLALRKVRKRTGTRAC